MSVGERGGLQTCVCVCACVCVCVCVCVRERERERVFCVCACVCVFAAIPELFKYCVHSVNSSADVSVVKEENEFVLLNARVVPP